ncbi:hypothetical protein D046_6386B, partial [Vibrio parahaemolyticus V-223/04]
FSTGADDSPSPPHALRSRAKTGTKILVGIVFPL